MDCRFCYFCGKFSLYLYLCNNWIAKTVGNCYEYFVEQGPKPQFGSPDKGTMPSGEKGGAATIFDAWGFGPKQQ